MSSTQVTAQHTVSWPLRFAHRVDELVAPEEEEGGCGVHLIASSCVMAHIHIHTQKHGLAVLAAQRSKDWCYPLAGLAPTSRAAE